MVSVHMPLPPVGPQSTRQEWLVLSCDKVHIHFASPLDAQSVSCEEIPLFPLPLYYPPI